MTEERKTPDPGAADDPRISDLYRDIASERAPGHLDQAVLREAGRAAQPRYSRLRLWTRPAAWAAIVLLSATLLLQVSQGPVPQDLSAPEIVEMEDAMEDAAEPRRDDMDSAAKATGTTVERQEQPAAQRLEEAVIQQADQFVQAEEMARMRQGPNEAPAAPVAASVDAPPANQARLYSSLASREAAQPSCDEEARSAPESWLACITDLEDAGFEAAAEQERELLAAMFPDFEAP
jgi:hypothetical protein